jgi:hypothetical protein
MDLDNETVTLTCPAGQVMFDLQFLAGSRESPAVGKEQDCKGEPSGFVSQVI